MGAARRYTKLQKRVTVLACWGANGDTTYIATHNPDSTMTNAQYVTRAAQLKGLSLIKPTKGNPGILAYDFSKKDARGVFPCVIDANNWEQARSQVTNHYRA